MFVSDICIEQRESLVHTTEIISHPHLHLDEFIFSYSKKNNVIKEALLRVVLNSMREYHHSRIVEKNTM